MYASHLHLNYSNAHIFFILRLSRCRSDAYMHRQSQSRNPRGLKFGIKANLIRDRLELCFYDNNMRLDLGSPQCTSTKSMESAVESVEAHVLDGYCARTRVGLGG